MTYEQLKILALSGDPEVHKLSEVLDVMLRVVLIDTFIPTQLNTQSLSLVVDHNRTVYKLLKFFRDFLPKDIEYGGLFIATLFCMYVEDNTPKRMEKWIKNLFLRELPKYTPYDLSRWAIIADKSVGSIDSSMTSAANRTQAVSHKITTLVSEHELLRTPAMMYCLAHTGPCKRMFDNTIAALARPDVNCFCNGDFAFRTAGVAEALVRAGKVCVLQHPEFTAGETYNLVSTWRNYLGDRAYIDGENTAAMAELPKRWIRNAVIRSGSIGRSRFTPSRGVSIFCGGRNHAAISAGLHHTSDIRMRLRLLGGADNVYNQRFFDILDLTQAELLLVQRRSLRHIFLYGKEGEERLNAIRYIRKITNGRFNLEPVADRCIGGVD